MVRTRQNFFWLLAILGLCAALFHPSPPRTASGKPTLAPPPEPIASATPTISLPPEAVCPICHSSAQAQPIYHLLSSCVVGPLDYERKERRSALSKGMHVEYGWGGSFGVPQPAWYCQRCKCHYQWSEWLLELTTPQPKPGPSQDCSQCDSDRRWAEWERNNKRTLKEMEERSAANERALEATRRKLRKGITKPVGAE